MIRLLLALVVVGALAWFMLRPHPHQDIAAAKVQPMLRTLQDNGCRSAATTAALKNNTTGRQALQALKSGIENCEARAAHRAENASSGH